MAALPLLLILLLTAPARGEMDSDSLPTAGGPLWRAETEYHLASPQIVSLQLAHAFVDTTGFQALVGGQVWRHHRDFRLRPREGLWIPLRPLGKESDGEVLVVFNYRFCPAVLAPNRELHAIISRPDSSGLASGFAGNGEVYGTEATAVGGLLVHGSKSIRVASGNRRELTVDQTLRLTIAGQLTPDIAVEASLSDDNLPVVPEGNTEELRDVDKVLVQLRAPTWQATLGDFVAQRSGTVFGNYRRKLQGISLLVTPAHVGFDGLAGSPRGVYRIVQLRGQESNQGPYRLGAGEIGGGLFIVAGSEKVTLDGQRLTRGADRDYIIDYVRGTITFTYRRLITAESTIVVEFEEGEGAYARSVVGAGAAVDFTVPLANGLSGGFTARFIQEQDDPQRLRSGELADSDEAVLAAAGDDPEQAVTGGVVQVAPGDGLYRREDVGGKETYIYDATLGDYQVSFFYFGPGDGDYGVDSLTVTGNKVFSYKGPGGGSYRIGRPLPLPARQDLATLAAFLGDRDNPLLQAEWNSSRQDLNRLSDLDDADNNGTAWVVKTASGEREIAWSGRSLGRITFTGQHEHRDAGFRPFLLQKDLFSFDRWGLGGRSSRPGFLEEKDSESEFTGQWALGNQRRSLRIQGGWGRLEHGESLSATRSTIAGDWRWVGGSGQSRWETANSVDRVDLLDVLRNRQQHRAGWDLWRVRPTTFLIQEEWEDSEVTGTNRAAGYRLRRYGGGLESLPRQQWRWRLGWERGLADSLRTQTWQGERDSRTVRTELSTPKLAGMRLVGDATWRRILEPGGLEQTTRLAKLDLSGQWTDWGSDWSLGYSLDNSRAEVLNRQVVFAGERQGDYNEAGDFLGRNQGDFNVIFVGTDSLVATTAVVADLSWRQDYGFLGRDRVWGAWSSLTQLTVKGRSRTDDISGLLTLRPEVIFADETAVLGEVNLKQELALLRHLRGLDLRLRYDFDEALDRQYAAHPEERLRRQYQAIITWSVNDLNSVRLRGSNGTENRATVESGASSRRSYRTSIKQYETEWSYRPVPGSRIALAAELIRRRDTVSTVSQREWALRPSSHFRLDERWSGLAEFRWAEVESDEPTGAVRPFFFAQPGRNLEASARLGWDPTEVLTVSLVYNGRRLGERGWQHDVRLESTARF
ncbi:MAG: hypothetical protein ABIF77_04105 [bacterium]